MWQITYEIDGEELIIEYEIEKEDMSVGLYGGAIIYSVLHGKLELVDYMSDSFLDRIADELYQEYKEEQYNDSKGH